MRGPLRLLLLLALVLGTLSPAFLVAADGAQAQKKGEKQGSKKGPKLTKLRPVKGALKIKVGVADQKADMSTTTGSSGWASSTPGAR